MKPLYIFLLSFLLVGCKTVKDVPYFQNAAEFDGEGKGYLFDMTIKPKDKLNIFVHSSQPRAVLQFAPVGCLFRPSGWSSLAADR